MKSNRGKPLCQMRLQVTVTGYFVDFTGYPEGTAKELDAVIWENKNRTEC